MRIIAVYRVKPMIVKQIMKQIQVMLVVNMLGMMEMMEWMEMRIVLSILPSDIDKSITCADWTLIFNTAREIIINDLSKDTMEGLLPRTLNKLLLKERDLLQIKTKVQTYGVPEFEWSCIVYTLDQDNKSTLARVTQYGTPQCLIFITGTSSERANVVDWGFFIKMDDDLIFFKDKHDVEQNIEATHCCSQLSLFGYEFSSFEYVKHK